LDKHHFKGISTRDKFLHSLVSLFLPDGIAKDFEFVETCTYSFNRPKGLGNVDRVGIVGSLLASVFLARVLCG